jgi:hypothetical protein
MGRQLKRAIVPVASSTYGGGDLLGDDCHGRFAIQQPLQMEAGKPVLRIATDQRGERGNRTGIAGFHFFEGLNVGPCFRAGTSARRGSARTGL